jgi:hypothetical protein
MHTTLCGFPVTTAEPDVTGYSIERIGAMIMHYHIQAQERDGRTFETVEKDDYRANTAALVIRRAGGKIIGSAYCGKDYQDCKRAAFYQGHNTLA